MYKILTTFSPFLLVIPLLLYWIDVMFKSFRFFGKVLKETALDPFCF